MVMSFDVSFVCKDSQKSKCLFGYHSTQLYKYFFKGGAISGVIPGGELTLLGVLESFDIYSGG